MREHGQPAAVLLDDAIVFADDLRFDRMRHILQKAAQYLQIIVLTCREREYQATGAPIISWLTTVCPEWHTQSRKSRSQSGSLLKLNVKRYVLKGTALSIHNRSSSPPGRERFNTWDDQGAVSAGVATTTWLLWHRGLVVA